MFRPIARSRQALPEAESLDLLKTTRRGVLSVLGEDGYPYGMPMNHWYCEENGTIYFHGGKKGHKIDALRACDRVSYCVMDGGTPSPDGWWQIVRSVIVFGRVELVEDYDRAMAVSRALSLQFTRDEAYIDEEIRGHGAATLVLALRPEYITGKTVTER